MLKADARLCTSEEEALAAKRHWRREEESDGEEAASGFERLAAIKN